MARHKMPLMLIALVAAWLLLPAGALADSDSQARIVRLSHVEGQVQLAHSGESGYDNAVMNVPIVEGDQIRTAEDGWAEIQFEDGGTVRLAPESQVTFSALGRFSAGGTITEVDLDQGEAAFNVPSHDGSEFRVNVRQRVISLHGSSRFRVTTLNDDPLEVLVWKGEVGVRDADSDQEVTVKKEETFMLDPNDAGRYELEKVAHADDLDQWSKQRDDDLRAYAANNAYTQSPYQYGLNDLNQYGQYYDVPGYGYCWQPYGVNVGWDPYANGYWTYSPGFGYSWVSAYPWGWMPFRYGRWVFVNGRGWLWQPGLWNRWNSGPRFVNAPPGFRAPVAPARPPVRRADDVPSRTAGPGRQPVHMDGGPMRRTITSDNFHHQMPSHGEEPARPVTPPDRREGGQQGATYHTLPSRTTVPVERTEPVSPDRNAGAPVTGRVQPPPPEPHHEFRPVPRSDNPPPVRTNVQPPPQEPRSYSPPPPARTNVQPPPPEPRSYSPPPPPREQRSYSPPPPAPVTHSAPAVAPAPAPAPPPRSYSPPPPPPPAAHSDGGHGPGKQQR